MIQPVSPIFHGRHIFAPAAAHLANGISIDEFGPPVPFNELVEAPYKNAVIKDNLIKAEVINVNKFGSLNLNILHQTWDEFKVKLGEEVILDFKGEKIKLPCVETFSQVKIHEPLILKDDYGRIEVAINLGDFAKRYNIKIGDNCIIQKLGVH